MIADWKPENEAPADTTLIVCGGGQLRFARKDKSGQWRNMMGGPKPAPKYWDYPPEAKS